MQNFISKFITPEKIPLVIEPKNSKISFEGFLQLLKNENKYLKEYILRHGGILFRNFPINNECDFAEVIESMNTGQSLDYIGGDSPRNKILKGIYTSTEAPPSIK